MTDSNIIQTDTAPPPVGAYPHARRVGDLLFLSGIGPRSPDGGPIPGVVLADARRRATDDNPIGATIRDRTESGDDENGTSLREHENG